MRVVNTSDSLTEVLGDRLDTFVCSASFEGRCLSVPKMLARDTDWNGRVLIASNSLRIPAVQRNQDELASLFAHGTVCQLDTDDPLITADRLIGDLRGLLPKGRAPQTIGLDITTFTRESLLIVFRCLVELVGQNDSVVGFYNRAQSYEGSEGDQWLSRGVREVRSVLGYPGDLKPTRRNHLVMLAGFEDDRSLQLTTELEPSVLSLGTPDPRTGHAYVHDEKMQTRKARWLAHLGCVVREFAFDGYGLKDCMESIGKAARAEPSMNVIVAAMNTKISTLAAGAYALTNPEVQVSYLQPDAYNHERYSVAANEVYWFDLSSVARMVVRT